MSAWSIAEKEVLITGGNSGIGLETAVALAARGARVTITARNRQRGEAALDIIRRRTGSAEVRLLDLDLASLASVRGAAGDYLDGGRPLHVLINNAGVCLSSRQTTEDGFEATFQVNHLGHFLFTQLLLQRILECAPARIINLASKAYSWVGRRGIDFDDLQSERHYRGLRTYGRSKLMNIYFTQELARRLAGSGVTANCLHPGVVATRFARDGDMTGIEGFLTGIVLACALRPSQGAKTSIHLATTPELSGVSGCFFQDSRETALKPIAKREEMARKLWDISDRLVADFSANFDQPN